MNSLLNRFMKYVTYDTTSDDSTGTHPSTSGQIVFARFLADELRTLNAERIRISKSGYVFAELSASSGCEHAPALGFIAHMDTSDAASGKNVSPRIVEWNGGTIPLGSSGKCLDPQCFPVLNELIGQTLVTTDGTTLLGADDKAGIAEIMTALELIVLEKIPHGKICVAFTPDEEIGEGALFFDVADFGADYAYTMDGGAVGELEYQNFNAAQAVFEIKGLSVHPGSAKNIMRNAQKIAFELNSMFPPEEVPEQTELFQGFYHLVEMSGTVASARMVYLIRDHDFSSFERRKRNVLEFADALNKKYGSGTVVVTLKEQYRNMEEIIQKYPFLMETAQKAIRAVGLEPRILPIRGGTDGAALSFMRLPCPNLGTGGYNFHGESEFVSVNGMTHAVQIILNLVQNFSLIQKESID